MSVEKTVKLSNDELSGIATDLVRRAQAENLTLKVIGGLATYIRCSGREDVVSLYDRVNRLGRDKPTFADVDFVGSSKQEKDVQNFLQRMGYEPDRYVNALFSGTRNVFTNKRHNFYVDIFYDMLNFSHDVVLVSREMDRLNTDALTILPTDLLLSKLQVHEVTRKDLVDIVLLLLGHDVLEEEAGGTIGSKYVASTLGDDWGFYFDAVNNLEKAMAESQAMVNEGIIDMAMQKEVSDKMSLLLNSIENYPKTRNWEKRARKGTKKIWYREVDEI